VRKTQRGTERDGGREKEEERWWKIEGRRDRKRRQ
jgi:hypothetical protein